MDLFEILVIAVGLSMDAFAVSIGKGLSAGKVGVRRPLIAGVWFGGFQAFMPLVGYLFCASFASIVSLVDHWIAFVLLVLIGGKMLWDLCFGEQESQDADFSHRTMFLLAIATSIDALAVGVSFAFLEVDILQAVTVIGVTTFLFSVAGVYLGNILGLGSRTVATALGGVVLISIGAKILFEHLYAL